MQPVLQGPPNGQSQGPSPLLLQMANITIANRGLGPRGPSSALTMGTTGTERHLLGGLAGAPLSSVSHARDGAP